MTSHKIAAFVPGGPQQWKNPETVIKINPKGKTSRFSRKVGKDANIVKSIDAATDMLNWKKREEIPIAFLIITFDEPAQKWRKVTQAQDKSGYRHHTAFIKYPDASNLLKNAEDACSKITYSDDKQIVDTRSIQLYGERVGSLIVVSEGPILDVHPERWWPYDDGLLQRIPLKDEPWTIVEDAIKYFNVFTWKDTF